MVLIQFKLMVQNKRLPFDIRQNISFVINADVEGNDVFIGTAHGLGWGVPLPYRYYGAR